MNSFPGLEAVAEAAHAELWRRLLDPQWGTLYDYSGLTGEVCLPTPAECAESRPNALSWWTPIENGAFFGGLYLHALCRRWQHRRDAATARDAATVAGGL
ncbi:MAG: hypothetical protein HUU35_19525, partial [Armatimonadetes bacterium]|nr:hypothetical protein [Armatimonadota bacterium]